MTLTGRPTGAPLPANHFAGAANITGPDGLYAYLNQLETFLSGLAAVKEKVLLEYVDAASFRLSALPGQPTLIKRIMQDRKFREVSTPLTYTFADLDTGSEAPATFYYAYLIPDPSDDSQMVKKLSANAPSAGPTGSSNFSYVGAIYNDGSSDLLSFTQLGTMTKLHGSRIAFSTSAPITPDGSPVSVSLAAYVPETAGQALLNIRVDAVSGGTGLVRLYIDGFTTEQFDVVLAENGGTEQRAIEIVTPNVPKVVYRKIEESVGDLNLVEFKIQGWIDSYLV